MSEIYPSSPEPVHNIMVTWNALEYTKIAIDSLFRTTHDPYFLSLVDNGSTDGTQQYLHSLASTKPDACRAIDVVENTQNVGYGGAINQAFPLHDTEYVTVANNDVVFTKDWMQRMKQVMVDDPRIAELGPLRPLTWCAHPYADIDTDTDTHLKSIPESYTPREELDAYTSHRDMETFARDTMLANDFGVRYLEGPPIHIVTCTAMLRRDAVQQVGGLADPRFEIFGCEDTDLSWRLSSAGLKLAITSNTYVHHFKHKSVAANNLDRKKYCDDNTVVFYEKWHETIQRFLQSQLDAGVDLNEKLSSEDDYEFWFLRRLRESIGDDMFWRGVKLSAPARGDSTPR